MRTKWTTRMVGEDMLVVDGANHERRVSICQFPDGTHGWWPVGHRGHPEKTLGDARVAAIKYLDTGKQPKHRKTKKITLDSVPDEEEDT